MSSRIKTTRKQLQKMADYMEKYPQLFDGNLGKDTDKCYKDKLWRELVDILNAEEDGPKKTVERWRRSFKDYKCYVKKKYLSYLADSSTLSPLSHLDVRVLAMMGYVVDIEGMNYSSNVHLQTFILEEINRDVVVDDIPSPECKEPIERFYHAPEIITIQQKGGNSSPTETQDRSESEMTPNKENSKTIEETSNNEEMQESSCNEVFDESPHNEESSCNEELPYSEKSPAKKSLSKKSKHKKQSLTFKKKRGFNSKNATAAALQAIAKELSMKNELSKQKIELGKEKLLLEKRKIEAFELIAKRLYRK